MKQVYRIEAIRLNAWKIPAWLEEKVKKRDKLCVYCHVPMKEYLHRKGTPIGKATWEHVDNDEGNISESNIVRCCSSCNKSKGAKKLSDWLESPYCKRNKINKKTIANVVRKSHQ